MKVVILIPSR